MEIVIQDNTIISVKLIRSKRSKHMRITADRLGVSVVYPINQDSESIRNFIRSNEKWILKKIKFYEKLNGILQYSPLQHDEIIYLGKKYRVQLVKDNLQYTILSEGLMKITFHVKDRRTYKRSVVNWYREQTKKLLDEKLPFFGKRLSISYGKVRIRSQKTRWGSCSKEGNLNFNLLLSSLPNNIINYIIIHELFHLVEFNHSNHFWRLVEDACPTYKECISWLKYNGAYLHG